MAPANGYAWSQDDDVKLAEEKAFASNSSREIVSLGIDKSIICVSPIR